VTQKLQNSHSRAGGNPGILYCRALAPLLRRCDPTARPDGTGKEFTKLDFKSLAEIKSSGFVGFKKISDLFDDVTIVPDERGIYFVLYLDGKPLRFLGKGVGGFFKGKNPNVSLQCLESNWVEGSIVIYIGQAGGLKAGKWSNQTLQKRIKKYMKFGQGYNIGHYGGRLIWQLRNYKDLVLCWKALPGKIQNPKKVEAQLISEFKGIYGRRPFANLQD